jgi:hypothetical protein
MDIMPSIKDPNNIKWLEENSETFLQYMANSHSGYDLAHTFLNYKSFNDAYVAGMIRKIKIHEKKLETEKKKRAAELKKEKNAPTTVIEKKMQKMEDIANRIEAEKRGDDDLLAD